VAQNWIALTILEGFVRIKTEKSWVTFGTVPTDENRTEHASRSYSALQVRSIPTETETVRCMRDIHVKIKENHVGT